MADIEVRMPDGSLQPMTYPDDWTDEQVKESIYKYFPQDSQSNIASTPFNDKAPQKPERTGFKGIGADVLQGLGNALKSGKGFLKDLPNESTASLEQIKEKPLRATGNILAGAGELAKDVINAPYNLNQYLSKKNLSLFPDIAKKYGWLIPHLPKDMGLEHLLSLDEEEKGDRLLRDLPGIAGTVYGGASLIGKARNALKKPDLKIAIRNTQAKVNEAKKELGGAFDKVAEEVDKRGIGAIPIKKDLISKAEKFLDKSPESRDLINRAKKGDYNALRDLQADLREIGESALSNKLSTERKIGKEALSTRKQINNAVEGHLDVSGHKDLAELLRETKGGYSELQKTYFSSPALARVFGKSQKVPKNPITLLTEESVEMKKFFSAHPEVQKMLEKALKHKSRAALLKSAGKIGMTALGVEEAGRLLHK